MFVLLIEFVKKRPRASAASRLPSKASFQKDQNDDKENTVMPKIKRQNKRI